MAKTEDSEYYRVFASEAGITKFINYSDLDREFEDFIRKENKLEKDDIQLALSGQGLVYILDFFYNKYHKPSKLVSEKEADFKVITPENVTTYAKVHGDELCIDAINFFIDYMAKYLTDLSFMFLPMGGIYLCASVIRGVEFMLQ